MRFPTPPWFLALFLAVSSPASAQLDILTETATIYNFSADTVYVSIYGDGQYLCSSDIFAANEEHEFGLPAYYDVPPGAFTVYGDAEEEKCIGLISYVPATHVFYFDSPGARATFDLLQEIGRLVTYLDKVAVKRGNAIGKVAKLIWALGAHYFPLEQLIPGLIGGSEYPQEENSYVAFWGKNWIARTGLEPVDPAPPSFSEVFAWRNAVAATGATGILSDGCFNGCESRADSCRARCDNHSTNCQNACDTELTTCTGVCTGAGDACRNLCANTGASCRSTCTNNGDSCRTTCYNTQNACVGVCETTRTGCRATCDASRLACRQAALATVACQTNPNGAVCQALLDACDDARTSCRQDCNSAFDACRAPCDNAVGPCVSTCDNTETGCITTCNATEGACTTACNTTETLCLAPCHPAHNACTTACTAFSTTCTGACNYTEQSCVHLCNLAGGLGGGSALHHAAATGIDIHAVYTAETDGIYKTDLDGNRVRIISGDFSTVRFLWHHPIEGLFSLAEGDDTIYRIRPNFQTIDPWSVEEAWRTVTSGAIVTPGAIVASALSGAHEDENLSGLYPQLVMTNGGDGRLYWLRLNEVPWLTVDPTAADPPEFGNVIGMIATETEFYTVEPGGAVYRGALRILSAESPQWTQISAGAGHVPNLWVVDPTSWGFWKFYPGTSKAYVTAGLGTIRPDTYFLSHLNTHLYGLTENGMFMEVNKIRGDNALIWGSGDLSINQPPTQNTPIAPIEVDPDATSVLDLENEASPTFSDPDSGDRLYYTVSIANPSLASAAVVDGELSVTGKMPGATTLTLNVYDGPENLVSTQVPILVTGTVPVETASLNVSTSDQGVRIQWAISGTRLDLVELSRAEGDLPWVSLATFQDPGQIQRGSWTDSNVGSGASYRYRVRVFEGGEEIFSRVASITLPVRKLIPARITGATPNPFRVTSKINFALGQPEDVEIRIYSLSGRLVRTLNRPAHPAGNGAIVWDGRDATGSPAPAGVYFVLLDTPSGADRTRIALLP